MPSSRIVPITDELIERLVERHVIPMISRMEYGERVEIAQIRDQMREEARQWWSETIAPHLEALNLPSGTTT